MRKAREQEQRKKDKSKSKKNRPDLYPPDKKTFKDYTDTGESEKPVAKKRSKSHMYPPPKKKKK